MCPSLLLQDLGAQVIAHQPSILQTALPDVADRALLRFMRVRLEGSPPRWAASQLGLLLERPPLQGASLSKGLPRLFCARRAAPAPAEITPGWLCSLRRAVLPAIALLNAFRMGRSPAPSARLRCARATHRRSTPSALNVKGGARCGAGCGPTHLHIRCLQDVTYRYSSLCTVLGDTPPVLVHAMSNAGFIAYGTMLHLVRPAAAGPQWAHALDASCSLVCLPAAPFQF